MRELKRNLDSRDDEAAGQTSKKGRHDNINHATQTLKQVTKGYIKTGQEAVREAGARGASPSNQSSSTPYSSVIDDIIHTPPKSPQQPATQEQTPLSTNSNFGSDPAGRSIMVLETGSGVSAHFDLDGDYVVRVKSIVTSSTNEFNVEVTKQLAQSAGMLFLQAEILRDLGEQRLAQYRASLPYLIGNTACRLDFTHHQ